MGPQSETVLNALGLSADDQKHYEIVLAALNAYFKPNMSFSKGQDFTEEIK